MLKLRLKVVLIFEDKNSAISGTPRTEVGKRAWLSPHQWGEGDLRGGPVPNGKELAWGGDFRRILGTGSHGRGWQIQPLALERSVRDVTKLLVRAE